MVRELGQRGHDVILVDPIKENLPMLQKPHFAYAEGKAPEGLEALCTELRAAAVT